MKSFIMVMMCVFAFLVFAAGAAPKKIIVPKDFRTIQKAIDEAEEDDTVYVQTGTYKENVVMKDHVALIGQDVNATILHGNGRKPVVEGANYALLKNFTIENGSVGVICKNTNPVISHCIIRSNHTGIHALISLPDVNNNIVYSNEWTGMYCELITSSQRTSIEHNLFAENRYCGIMLASKSEVLIQDNVFFQNKQYGVYVNEDSKRSRIVYNDFYNNRASYNMYAVINETNVTRNPVLPADGNDEFTFAYFSGEGRPLAGLGKNGSNIGPMPEYALSNAKVRVDSDGDGVPDDVDQCPDVPEDKDGFQDEDGCPDYDNDNDGIYDLQDKCPNEPEDFDGFEDSDGCPDYDNDRDGIPDNVDKCPNTPEDIDGYQDDDGCPDGGGPGKMPGAPKNVIPAKAIISSQRPITANAPAADTVKKVEQVPVKK